MFRNRVVTRGKEATACVNLLLTCIDRRHPFRGSVKTSNMKPAFALTSAACGGCVLQALHRDGEWLYCSDEAGIKRIDLSRGTVVAWAGMIVLPGRACT